MNFDGSSFSYELVIWDGTLFTLDAQSNGWDCYNNVETL